MNIIHSTNIFYMATRNEYYLLYWLIEYNYKKWIIDNNVNLLDIMI